MVLKLRGLVLGVATAFAAGCGASSPGAVQTYPDAQALDGAGKEALSVDAGTADDSMKPPPMSGEGNVGLFKGPAQMLANRPSCTNEVGATGDRWCAFLARSNTSLDGLNLFVMNVSRAAAGVTVACESSMGDPNCLKLTGGFFEEAEAPFRHAAGFQGDTLIYFDRTGAGYGWRPGMINGRLLAAGAIYDCFASPMGSSVLCLRDLVPQPIAGLTQSEVLVGRLEGGTTPPLTRVDTVISNEPSVAAGAQRFRVGFRPDGEYVAWSSRAEADGLEILKTQRVGDNASLVTVASDVSRWNISPDGSRWYWLSKFNYDVTGKRSGVLQTASFPAGTAPATLLPDVGDFALTRSGAVVARTMVANSRGTLQGIPNPVAAPGTVTTMDTGVIAFLGVGAQGHVVYTKAVDPLFPFADLYLRNLDGTGTVCVLTTRPVGRTVMFFSPAGGAVVWASVTNLDSPIDTEFKFRASYTRIADCKTSTVASNIGGFGIVGETGVLVEDENDGIDGRLRIQHVTAGNVVATQPPVLIQTRVNDYVAVMPQPGVILFTVNAGSPQDGLYLHAITPPTPGSTDAATDNGDGGQTTDGGAAAADGAPVH